MAVDRYDPGTLDWVALHHGEPPAPRKPAAGRRKPRRKPRAPASRPGQFELGS